MIIMLGSGEVLPAASSKPVRPTIHVQLDVKGNEEDASNGNCGNEVDPVAATAAPSLRVSFTGAKRSDLSLFRASSPAVSEHQVVVCV